jgi:hypothetical protein
MVALVRAACHRTRTKTRNEVPAKTVSGALRRRTAPRACSRGGAGCLYERTRLTRAKQYQSKPWPFRKELCSRGTLLRNSTPTSWLCPPDHATLPTRSRRSCQMERELFLFSLKQRFNVLLAAASRAACSARAWALASRRPASRPRRACERLWAGRHRKSEKIRCGAQVSTPFVMSATSGK